MTGSAVTARAQQATVPAWAIIALMAVIGLNLRASLGSIPPLLQDMTRDLHLSGLAQGLLTSVAVAFMGLGAPMGQKVAARIGVNNAMTVMLGVLSIGCLARVIPVGLPLFLVSCMVVGAGMGGASALVPSLIMTHVARRRGFALGLYSVGTSVGVALAAWIAVPTDEWLGGWRQALALWGAVAAVTLLVWAGTARRLHAVRPAGPVVDHRLPWRAPTAWWITWFTASAMMIGFSGLAWVSPLYIHLGGSQQQAAGYFVIFQLAGLLAMLALPVLADYTSDRRPLLALVVALSAAGMLCLVLAPLELAVPAMVMFGFGAGGSSTLAMVALVDVTHTQADAARLGAMVMLVAYLVGATGPAMLGVLRQFTGSFTAGYVVLLGLAFVSLATVPVFHPRRSLEFMS